MSAVALLVLGLSACGKSEQQKQADEAARNVEKGAQAMQKGAEQMAESAQQSSQQMAQGLQQMAQGFQQMAQGATKSVDYEQLKALLPEVPGWTRSDAKGEQISAPITYARAEARYRQDDRNIELEITDTAMSQLLLAPMSMFLGSGYSERSDEGFKRAMKIGSVPGYEEWNTESKRGEVTALVNNRFVVHATGHDVESLDAVRKLVESVDLAKLGTLK
jgi:X-X-X-Leu-X-X-Gly heptad repeat protein